MTIEEKTLYSLVNAAFDVDIKRPTRKRQHVTARKVYARILKERGWNLVAIGMSMHKDHSTIIHYLKDMVWLLEHDTHVRNNYLHIKRSLDKKIQFNPLTKFSTEALHDKIYQLQDENKLLISALENLDKKIKREERFKNIFKTIITKLPTSKTEEFEIKIKRLLNGIA